MIRLRHFCEDQSLELLPHCFFIIAFKLLSLKILLVLLVIDKPGTIYEDINNKAPSTSIVPPSVRTEQGSATDISASTRNHSVFAYNASFNNRAVSIQGELLSTSASTTSAAVGLSNVANTSSHFIIGRFLFCKKITVIYSYVRVLNFNLVFYFCPFAPWHA